MHKSKSLAIIITVCLVIGVFALANKLNHKAHRHSASVIKNPQRVISLSPSITEILFYVNAGRKVVGVTSFCEYPEEVKTLPKTGGFVDPNFEEIIKLKPDLVIMREEHLLAKEKLSKLGINILTVNHMSLEGILESVKIIGKACNEEKIAGEKSAELSRFLIKKAPEKLPLPNILLCIGRNMGSGSIKDVYVAGEDGLYDEIITLAGGKNCCKDMGAKYPKLDPEKIQKLNPDIIVDLAVDLKEKNIGIPAVLAEWGKLSHLNAVKNKNIIVFTKDYCVIPGPRMFQFITDLRNIIKEHHNE